MAVGGTRILSGCGGSSVAVASGPSSERTGSKPATMGSSSVLQPPLVAGPVSEVVPEVVEPGITGWLCEPSHLRSLVEGLAQVATATLDELRALGAAAARRVGKAHDREVSLARTADLIRELTRGSGQGATDVASRLGIAAPA